MRAWPRSPLDRPSHAEQWPLPQPYHLYESPPDYHPILALSTGPDPASRRRDPHLRLEEYEGHQIVVFDFFGEKDPKAPLRHVDALTRFMAGQPRTKSLLTLTDVREAHYDGATIAVLKKFAAHNAPFVKAAAVLCTSPTHRLAVSTVARFTGRTIRAFAEPAEAKEWLIRQ